MDLNKYYRDVRAVAASLPPAPIYYLVSIETGDSENKVGRVMDLPTARAAAELIVGKSHILASKEDIARFHADLESQAEEMAKIELDRKGQLAMPKDLQDLVRMAAEGVRQQTERKKEK